MDKLKSISMEVTGEQMPVVFSYGGGTNSAAILIELINRRYSPPDLIVFSDAGAEQPHTYESLLVMSEYAQANGYPAITTVRNEGVSRHGGLYEMCMKNRVLPSVAYGFKQCSVIFKLEPQQSAIKARGWGRWVNIIGYDFDEVGRAEASKGKEKAGQINWFPLIELQMGREECIKSIAAAGLPLPGKSACYMCPNRRPWEIKKLAQDYPDLAAKAVELEERATERRADDGIYGSIVGLGRTWRWKDLLATDDMFGFPDVNRDAPCGCYDGDE